MCCTEFQQQIGGDINCYRVGTAVKHEGRKFSIEPKTKGDKLNICIADIDCLNLIITGKRCDYLMYNCDSKDCLLIELKGQDYAQAALQLGATIQFVRPKLQATAKLHAFMVTSKIPSGSGDKLRKLKEDFYKEHKVSLDSQNIQLVHKI